jgi:hypothetical protein
MDFRIESLDQMFTIGLFLNDYNISDWNRDIIMASVQKSDSMKELLKEEREKSRQLARNLKECGVLKKRSRELLAELMPKQLANDFLKNSKGDFSNICEVYMHWKMCIFSFLLCSVSGNFVAR